MYLTCQTMPELSTIWSVQNLKESSLNRRWQRIHEQCTFCSPISKARKKGNVILEIYMEGLGTYVIMIIDFGVFGNSRCALHDPDGILIGVLIQPPGLSCSSCQPSSSFKPSQCSLLSQAFMSHQLLAATSSGRKSGCPIILRRFWKLDCDFFSPSFQYHSPSRNNNWFGYR